MTKRNRYKTHNTMQVVYRDFIKGSPTNKLTVSNQTLYSQILYNVFRKIVEYMLFKSYEYKMDKLGKFSIIKYLPEIKETEDGRIITNKVLDIHSTKEAIKETGNNKIRVYYDNEATGGYIYRMNWDNNHFAFPNMTFYKFSFSRPLRSYMKDRILENKVVAKIVDFKL